MHFIYLKQRKNMPEINRPKIKSRFEKSRYTHFKPEQRKINLDSLISEKKQLIANHLILLNKLAIKRKEPQILKLIKDITTPTESINSNKENITYKRPTKFDNIIENKQNELKELEHKFAKKQVKEINESILHKLRSLEVDREITTTKRAKVNKNIQKQNREINTLLEFKKYINNYITALKLQKVKPIDLDTLKSNFTRQNNITDEYALIMINSFKNTIPDQISASINNKIGLRKNILLTLNTEINTYNSELKNIDRNIKTIRENITQEWSSKQNKEDITVLSEKINGLKDEIENLKAIRQPMYKPESNQKPNEPTKLKQARQLMLIEKKLYSLIQKNKI